MDNNKEYLQALAEAGKELEETREEVIQGVASLLRCMPFTVEFEVADKPSGIKVIYEVSQEDMEKITRLTIERHHESN